MCFNNIARAKTSVRLLEIGKTLNYGCVCVRICVLNCFRILVDVASLLESFSCCSSLCCSLTSSQVYQTQATHLLPTRLQRKESETERKCDYWIYFLLLNWWCAYFFKFKHQCWCFFLFTSVKKFHTKGAFFPDYFHLSTMYDPNKPESDS